MDLNAPLRLALWLFGLAAVSALLIGGLASGPYERELYLRTWELAWRTAALSLPLSFFLAVSLFRGRFPGRRFLQAMLLAQLFFPLYLQAAAWEAGFGRLGWYSVSSDAVQSPWLTGMRGAVWTHVAASIPWTTLLLAVGLLSGERELEEAALLDEPPRWVLVRVILPRLVPWMMVALVWVLISAATDMTAADLYLVDTYPRVIYTGFALQSTLGELTWRTAGAIFWITQLALSALLLTQRLLPAGRITVSWSGANLVELIPPSLAAAIAWTWWFTMAALPWGNLVYLGGRFQALPGMDRWSVGRLGTVLNLGRVEFQSEIRWTLVIGGLATLLVVPLGLSLAWMARRHRPTAWVITIGLSLLIAFPAPLLGLWLLAALIPWHISGLVWLTDQTVFLPVMAAMLRQLPWATLVAWLAIRQVPRAQFEAADLEGISGWRQAIWIAAAQVPATWLVIAVLAMGLSAGELSATLMVTPPGVSTVATRIFGLIHAGVRDKEAALALLNIAGCLSLSLLLLAWMRRRWPFSI